MNMEDELIQYYIVNSQIEMSKGKCAAQCSHVATIIAVEIMKPFSKFTSQHKIWFDEWFTGEMKKIVLKGKEKDLNKLIEQGFTYIRDNGHTELEPDTLTVVALPPMPKSEAQQYVKRLRLY